MNEKKKSSNRIVYILLVTFTIYIGYTLYDQQQSINTLTSQVNRVQREIDDKNKKIESLKKEISKVNTPEYVEKYAREKLNMIQNGDIAYVDVAKEGEGQI